MSITDTSLPNVIEDYREPDEPDTNGWERTIRLFNFPIKYANLRPEHHLALARIALIAEESGWICNIQGRASRSGTSQLNKGLSEQRAENVRQAIIGYGLSPGLIKQSYGAGEEAWQYQVPDGVENDLHRCVFVEFWSLPTELITAGARHLIRNRLALRTTPLRRA